MSNAKEDDCRCASSYYNTKPKLKLQSETTHKSNFKAYPIEQQPAYQMPKVVQKHYDPSVLQTNYKSNYVKPVIKTEDRVNEASQINNYLANKPKNVPFYSETEYNKSFQKNDVKFQKQPAYEYKAKNTKFQGQSSYKAEFVQKKNVDSAYHAEPAALKDYLAKKPKIAFEGQTSYNQTFKDHGVRPQKQPEYKYQPKNVKFQGESSYKSTFKQLPPSAYKSDLEYCPVHPSKVAIK